MGVSQDDEIASTNQHSTCVILSVVCQFKKFALCIFNPTGACTLSEHGRRAHQLRINKREVFPPFIKALPVMGFAEMNNLCVNGV